MDSMNIQVGDRIIFKKELTPRKKYVMTRWKNVYEPLKFAENEVTRVRPWGDYQVFNIKGTKEYFFNTMVETVVK